MELGVGVFCAPSAEDGEGTHGGAGIVRVPSARAGECRHVGVGVFCMKMAKIDMEEEV